MRREDKCTRIFGLRVASEHTVFLSFLGRHGEKHVKLNNSHFLNQPLVS